MESHLIVVKPYGNKLTILIGGTEDELAAEFKKRRVKMDEANNLAKFLMESKKDADAWTINPATKPGALFIWLQTRPNLNNPKHVNLISHEVSHCILRIFHRAGIKVTFATEEPFAYLTGQVMGEIWQRLKKE